MVEGKSEAEEILSSGAPLGRRQLKVPASFSLAFHSPTLGPCPPSPLRRCLSQPTPNEKKKKGGHTTERSWAFQVGRLSSRARDEETAALCCTGRRKKKPHTLGIRPYSTFSTVPQRLHSPHRPESVSEVLGTKRVAASASQDPSPPGLRCCLPCVPSPLARALCASADCGIPPMPRVAFWWVRSTTLDSISLSRPRLEPPQSERLAAPKQHLGSQIVLPATCRRSTTRPSSPTGLNP